MPMDPAMMRAAPMPMPVAMPVAADSSDASGGGNGEKSQKDTAANGADMANAIQPLIESNNALATKLDQLISLLSAAVVPQVPAGPKSAGAITPGSLLKKFK